jgi:hypothetical protein
MQKLVEVFSGEASEIKTLSPQMLPPQTLPPQWREFYRLSREMAAEVKRIRQSDEPMLSTANERCKVTQDKTDSK